MSNSLHGFDLTTGSTAQQSVQRSPRVASCNKKAGRRYRASQICTAMLVLNNPRATPQDLSALTLERAAMCSYSHDAILADQICDSQKQTCSVRARTWQTVEKANGTSTKKAAQQGCPTMQHVIPLGARREWRGLCCAPNPHAVWSGALASCSQSISISTTMLFHTQLHCVTDDAVDKGHTIRYHL